MEVQKPEGDAVFKEEGDPAVWLSLISPWWNGGKQERNWQK